MLAIARVQRNDERSAHLCYTNDQCPDPDLFSQNVHRLAEYNLEGSLYRISLLG